MQESNIPGLQSCEDYMSTYFNTLHLQKKCWISYFSASLTSFLCSISLSNFCRVLSVYMLSLLSLSFTIRPIPMWLLASPLMETTSVEISGNHHVVRSSELHSYSTCWSWSLFLYKLSSFGISDFGGFYDTVHLQFSSFCFTFHSWLLLYNSISK